MTGRYLVAIASYRRPSGLTQLLDSLHAAIDPYRADVLVVDNDPAESARRIVSSHPIRATYRVEPQPGIPSARNHALQLFSERYRAIIFVDDDERVSQDWFTTLTSYAAKTAADVVQGPVIAVLPPTAPRWASRGGFHQRSMLKSGSHLRYAATNNTLLCRSAWLRAGAPTFDTSFSVTGGSDTDFFWGIRKSGSTILFCDSAVVYEDIPPERLTLSWVRTRAIRDGTVETRVRLKHHDFTPAWPVRSGARAAQGVVALGLGLIRGQGLQAKPYHDVFRACGRLAALFDYRVTAYDFSDRHGSDVLARSESGSPAVGDLPASEGALQR